eukprot:5817711-Amphidinium_carterae.1
MRSPKIFPRLRDHLAHARFAPTPGQRAKNLSQEDAPPYCAGIYAQNTENTSELTETHPTVEVCARAPWCHGSHNTMVRGGQGLPDNPQCADSGLHG